jgi:hypothetical protein
MQNCNKLTARVAVVSTVAGLAQPTVDGCDNLTHAGNRHCGYKDWRPLMAYKDSPAAGVMRPIIDSCDNMLHVGVGNVGARCVGVGHAAAPDGPATQPQPPTNPPPADQSRQMVAMYRPRDVKRASAAAGNVRRLPGNGRRSEPKDYKKRWRSHAPILKTSLNWICGN